MEKILKSIASERRKQKAKYKDDDSYIAGQLARAAIWRIADANTILGGFPLYKEALNGLPCYEFFSHHDLPQREKLIEAAALIIAEIERIDRRNARK